MTDWTEIHHSEKEGKQEREAGGCWMGAQVVTTDCEEGLREDEG